MLTKGQYRVGVSFNPSGSGVVDEIKQQAAMLIDSIDKIGDAKEMDDITKGEVARLKALAMTAVEDAAMWAVKAATKPAYEV